MHEMTLPMPPSNNRYYRHARGRTYLSDEGKAYKKAVATILFNSRHHEFTSVRVEIDIHAKNNVRRDLDNFPKGIFDALTFAGAWKDDSIVDEMEIIRSYNDKNNPHIVVRIIDLD